MKLLWTENGWIDYTYWIENDAKTVSKINDLLKQTLRSPFQGTGKPEPLRNEMAGWWSRRITQEHRLIYRVTGKDDAQTLEIASCRFHYRR